MTFEDYVPGPDTGGDYVGVVDSTTDCVSSKTVIYNSLI